MGINAGHLTPRHKPQHFRNARGSGTANVIPSQYVDGGRALPDLFWLLGGCRHFHVTEFRQTQLPEGLAICWVRLWSGDTAVDQPREHKQDDESSALRKYNHMPRAY